MATEEKPLKVALHGMDSRSTKTIMLFFQGPCKGSAVVVNSPEDADVFIFDADVAASKNSLDNFLRDGLKKPAIVLSLKEIAGEGVLCLKKPAKIDSMQQALGQVKSMAVLLAKKTAEVKAAPKMQLKRDDFDFFNDELFDYIASTSWDEAPKPETSPQILRTVTAPEPVVTQPEPTPPAAQENEEEEKGDGNVSVQALPEEDGMTSAPAPDPEPSPAADISVQLPEDTPQPELKAYVSKAENGVWSMRQAAMHLNEKGLRGSSLGFLDDFGIKEKSKLVDASYDPGEYFQGYLQSAINMSRAKSQEFIMKTRWCPIVLFGEAQMIWLDASDSELQEFASLKLKHKNITTKISISPLDSNAVNLQGTLGKYQNMDVFLWKLACWTSKGRFPTAIDYNMPVYLKHWPNFTRLLVTPDALRIAALMIRGPRTMLNIAETLKINPQYVFVFVSAAYALGYAGQARRLSDVIIQPQEVQPAKDQGVLSRIMSKLRIKA